MTKKLRSLKNRDLQQMQHICEATLFRKHVQRKIGKRKKEVQRKIGKLGWSSPYTSRRQERIHYTNYKGISVQGRTQEFFKRGLKFWEKYFALTKVQANVFTITFTVCHICYFNINISTLFLTTFSRDVCFLLPVFPRYGDLVDLLKYDAM